MQMLSIWTSRKFRRLKKRLNLALTSSNKTRQHLLQRTREKVTAYFGTARAENRI